MNILHMKYAVEIAKCGSINKAAERLMMNQPNLSRAVKELETSIGVKIFERSAKGIAVTPEGIVFLKHANKILKQVDDLEKLFDKSEMTKKKFSITVPRASYISRAFANFSKCLDKESDIEIFYKETNSQYAVKNILEDGYNLGIIRYAEHFDKFFKESLEERGLSYELIAEFRHEAVMSRNHPLAEKENLSRDEVEKYIEIAHAEPFIPFVPIEGAKKEDLSESNIRRIFVFERASQFEILSANPETFMWASPMHESELERYGLVQKKCTGDASTYKDMIIYKKNYRLSELDNIFISELLKSKRELF